MIHTLGMILFGAFLICLSLMCVMVALLFGLFIRVAFKAFFTKINKEIVINRQATRRR